MVLAFVAELGWHKAHRHFESRAYLAVINFDFYVFGVSSDVVFKELDSGSLESS